MSFERWTDEDWTESGNWIPSSFHGWQNISNTRDDTGAFTVSVNGTSRITVTDNDHIASGFFGWMCDPWSAIDNVVVNELEIIITSTPTNTTTTPIPGFPAIAIVVGTCTALFIGVLYRRRHTKS